ncbi:MAG: DUF3572 domain-containing protein [Rhodobacteraceae bacterium]|nr:DUF3572 domain-containing protein [Paracoccaceae bacterium]
MQKRQGEIIAIRSLEWLARDEDLMRGFLTATGTDLAEVSERAESPEFLAAVLDYLLSSDRNVTSFCEECGIPPEAPMAARQLLPGGDSPHWT